MDENFSYDLDALKEEGKEEAIFLTSKFVPIDKKPGSTLVSGLVSSGNAYVPPIANPPKELGLPLHQFLRSTATRIGCSMIRGSLLSKEYGHSSRIEYFVCLLGNEQGFPIVTDYIYKNERNASCQSYESVTPNHGSRIKGSQYPHLCLYSLDKGPSQPSFFDDTGLSASFTSVKNKYERSVKQEEYLKQELNGVESSAFSTIPCNPSNLEAMWSADMISEIGDLRASGSNSIELIRVDIGLTYEESIKTIEKHNQLRNWVSGGNRKGMNNEKLDAAKDLPLLRRDPQLECGVMSWLYYLVRFFCCGF